MKFTLSWLKTHLETDATLQQITDTLTRIGLELEDVEDRGAALAPFRIARVVEAVQHPNADRLRVCTVDTGERHGTRGLRRAECAHRHEGRVRPARHVHPRHRHHAEGGRDPRRAQRRHAAVRARDGSRRRSRRHRRPAGGCTGRRALRAMGRPGRSGDRCQRHAEPRRLLLGARHRARPRRRRHRHAEAVAAGRSSHPRFAAARAGRSTGPRPAPGSSAAPSATCATDRARNGCRIG